MGKNDNFDLSKAFEVFSEGSTTDPEVQKVYDHPLYLGEAILTDAGKPVKFEPFHFEMADNVIEAVLNPHEVMEKDMRLLSQLELIPRGHGKTTMKVFEVAWLLGRNPNLRIGYVTANVQIARTFLSQVDGIMRTDIYVKAFGPRVAEDSPMHTWNSQEKYVLGRTVVLKDPSLSGLGITGAAMNRRYDVLFYDDIVTPENASTGPRRLIVRNKFFQEFAPTLESPYGVQVASGTRQHPQDLWGEIEKNPTWHVTKMKMCDLREDSEKKFHIVPGSILWEKKFPPRHVQKLKDGFSHLHFSLNYMNDDSAWEGAIFRNIPILFYDKSELPAKEELTIFFGVDPAMSEKEDSSYFVVVVGAYHKKSNRVFILEIYREHLSPKKQADKLQEMAVRWKPRLVCIEINGAQVYLSEWIKDEDRQRRFLVPVYESESLRPKEMRFVDMSLAFENRQIYLGNDHTVFVEEWNAYPGGDHDDVLAAMEKLIEVALDSIGPPAWIDFTPTMMRNRQKKLEAEDEKKLNRPHRYRLSTHGGRGQLFPHRAQGIGRRLRSPSSDVQIS